MTNLFKLVRDFVARQGIEREWDFLKGLYLMDFYRENAFEKRFEQVQKKMRGTLQVDGWQDEQLFFRQFLVEREIHRNENDRHKRTGNLNLPETLEALDKFYVVTKWKYACFLAQQKKFTNLETAPAIVPEKELSPLLQLPEEIPLLKIYDLALKLIHGKEEDLDDLFESYHSYLEKNADQFPTDDLQHLNSFLRSFCTARYNEGEIRYLEILFDIHGQHLEKRYLHDGDFLPHSVFTNMIAVGLEIEKI